MTKIFNDSDKSPPLRPPSPTYLMYGPLVLYLEKGIIGTKCDRF